MLLSLTARTSTQPTVGMSRRAAMTLLAAATWADASWGRDTVERRPTKPAIALLQEAPADIDPAGFLVSEKYDGARGVWDGEQLRFRSGLPVPAPRWFTERLPPVPLDGELWLGRGRFEALSGAVRRQVPDDAEWRAIRYMVFELPGGQGDFSQRAARIKAMAAQVAWGQLAAAPQLVVADRAALARRLDEVVQGGGEGLVLHRADALYATGRLPGLLKLKPLQDAEAVVLGHEPGQGRHAGRLGALRVRSEDGREFSIGTGLSDAQRTQPPAIGTQITFSYRGRTESGLPRFASFKRESGI